MDFFCILLDEITKYINMTITMYEFSHICIFFKAIKKIKSVFRFQEIFPRTGIYLPLWIEWFILN